MDFSGSAQLKKIERMISDNYTIIVISFVTLILLFIIIKYFAKQIYNTIHRYRMSYGMDKKDKAVIVDDSEIYDEDDPPIDTTKYFDAGKTDFVKNLETAYKNYNKLKGEYIRTTYNTDNDDTIDQKALYGKYDDYTYAEQK
jgi:hypothetical protein